MIETPRLILRPPIYSDFKPMIEMFSEEPVLRQIGKLNRSEIWTRLLRDVGHWQLMGFGQFSIIERAQNTYAGKVGFAVFERPLGRADTNIEMSWTLQSGFHGRGYATEAAQAVQHWFERDHRQPTACLIAVGNVLSLRLAERLGYKEIDKVCRDKGDAIILQRDP
ncbi:GNAT family N-acetyltransferase [Agrobacterium sp. Ap1]|jgi:RimJ/RimL family protein N-acetyltransferase|uniref:GNAT family N-acetyltransferase n=1 Tax=Endobacterium cereale TaxID=2663029 RepID=A0A6A8A841_9HYPH|nr:MULTISPECIES: GNAT family N-acetyltransferase [Rhizobiaceae]MBO0144821.1 GNAT family N-acetyltransferase [Agrobacterium sp. Ap1]MQY45820.1 GNAT family N-acetyltransferase [Endobacterium cereale]